MTSHTTQAITRYGSGLLLFPEFWPNLKSIFVRKPTPPKELLPSWIDTALERITALSALGGSKVQSQALVKLNQEPGSSREILCPADQHPSHVLEPTETRTQQLAEAMEERHAPTPETSQLPELAIESESAHAVASGSETETSHPETTSEATATRASRGWAKAISPRVAVLKLRAAKSGCLKPMTRKEMVRLTTQAAAEWRLKHGDEEEDEDYVDSSDDEDEEERKKEEEEMERKN
jgi:hypothetical protein